MKEAYAIAALGFLIIFLISLFVYHSKEKFYMVKDKDGMYSMPQLNLTTPSGSFNMTSLGDNGGVGCCNFDHCSQSIHNLKNPSLPIF